MLLNADFFWSSCFFWSESYPKNFIFVFSYESTFILKGNLSHECFSYVKVSWMFLLSENTRDSKIHKQNMEHYKGYFHVETTSLISSIVIGSDVASRFLLLLFARGIMLSFSAFAFGKWIFCRFGPTIAKSITSLMIRYFYVAFPFLSQCQSNDFYSCSS